MRPNLLRRLCTWLALVAVAMTLGLAQTPVSAKTYSQQKLVQIAHSLVDQNALSWGIDSSQFRVEKVIATNDGLTTIRFTQIITDVPVLNSLIAVTLLNEGTYLSHVSKVSTVDSVAPAHISARTASQIALAAFNEQHQLTDNSSTFFNATSQLADPALVDFVQGGAQRVWEVKIQNASHPELTSIVFISDVSAKPLTIRRMSQDFGAFPFPYVCDLQKTKPTFHFSKYISTKRINNRLRNYIGKTPDYPLCEHSDPARIKNSSAASVQSITQTINYFRHKIGVDIAAEKYLGNVAPYANFGKRLNAKTFCNKNPKSKYCVATISGYTNVCSYDSQSRDVECPFDNAFWVPWITSDCRSGVCSGIFFGAGYDKADDVVAHELAHGVTASDAFPLGLCETCDAGAISEALSDFFGEAVDQLNVRPKELPDPNWQLGEDTKGGAIRNMAMVGEAKSCLATYEWVPVKQIDSNWNKRCDEHTNLGPADRFAWLLSNGGSQNGIEVSPIGNAPWGKNNEYQLCNSTGSNCTATVNMTRLAFQALAKLNSNISYAGFGTALNKACTDLTKAKKDPFPSSYCASVRNALAATGISGLKFFNITQVFNYTGTPTAVSAQFGTASSVVGSAVAMRLQFQATGSVTWQTLETENTSSSGIVNFSTTFPSSGAYRIATVPSETVGTFVSTSYSIN